MAKGIGLFILVDYIEVIFLGLFASIISLLINKNFGSTEQLSQIKVDQHRINQLIKEARKSGDNQKMKELSEQAVKKSEQHFNVNIKPMVISFFVYVAFLIVIWFYYLGWFLLYFVTVIMANYLLKKCQKRYE